MPTIPMFPLGTVLFPHMLLPLHVFEERYRELTRRCLDGDREFGVVLIERGHEVGGGDARTDVGTVAHISQASELEDGRFALVTVGTRRVRVTRWLPDDPHPWAEVEDDLDPPADDDARLLREAALGRLRSVLALLQVIDATDARPLELHPDPEVASYQACTLAPVGPLDAQRLLEVHGHSRRLELLCGMLDDAEDLIRLQHEG